MCPNIRPCAPLLTQISYDTPLFPFAFPNMPSYLVPTEIPFSPLQMILFHLFFCHWVGKYLYNPNFYIFSSVSSFTVSLFEYMSLSLPLLTTIFEFSSVFFLLLVQLQIQELVKLSQLIK